MTGFPGKKDVAIGKKGWEDTERLQHCKYITGYLPFQSDLATEGFFLDLLGRRSFSINWYSPILSNSSNLHWRTGDTQWPGHVVQIERSEKHFSQIRCFTPKNPDEMTWRCIHFGGVHYCLFLLGLVILQLYIHNFCFCFKGSMCWKLGYWNLSNIFHAELVLMNS